MNVNNPTMRDSRIEAFRIVLMWGIVSYHLLIHGLPGTRGIPACSATLNLLHVAVPCFVLLSGWFGIRPSIRGFVRLWFLVFFYGMLELSFALCSGVPVDWKQALRFAFPLFGSRWWFFTTYLSLYLVSPILNAFLGKSCPRSVWGAILALFAIAFWFKLGTAGGELSKQSGLALFSALYLLGSRLHAIHSAEVRSPLPFRHPIATLLVLTSFSFVFGWLAPTSSVFARANGILFFRYNSPGLVLLAASITQVVLAPHGDWHSQFVNRIAASVFPVYLLHEANPAFSPWLYETFRSCALGRQPSAVIGLALLFGLSILLAGLAVDQVLRPLHTGLSTSLANAIGKIKRLPEREP